MRGKSSAEGADLIADLNDLIQLDHDAVQAYTVAIDLVRDDRHRESLVAFRADHKRHIEELAAIVRARGGLPIELPHPTSPLKLAVQALGGLPNDTALLLAFKAVEGQARDKYVRAAGRSWPDDAADVVRRGAEDERRHYTWVEQALREAGAGAGTLPHTVAQAVEMIHKLVANPIERAEREVMKHVGKVVGTVRGHGSMAPSPADVADSARGAGAGGASTPFAGAEGGTGRGDAQRFIDALRAVEEHGDVERMVALYDESAEVSNPNDRIPHRGPEGARRFWQTYRDSFEEVRSDFSKVVEADGTAVLEWTSRGRVQGADVEYSGVSIVEMTGGRVRRFRAYFDPTAIEPKAHATE